MARIAHLSDVHFGCQDDKVVDGANAWLQEQQPDLIIVSGDFTQRARVEQFKQASTWLNKLRAAGWPVLAVRYKKYISNDLCPWFENDEVAVLGINTARSLTIKDGRINRDQMKIIEDRFAAVAAEKTKILVTHHPLFSMPIGEGTELTEAVGRHEDAVTAVCRAGVNIALAGHFHRTYAEAARKMVEKAGGALVIQAGTATSKRLRNNELQSFNWIHAHRNNDVELQVIAWDGTGFRRGSHVRFNYDGDNWNSQTVTHDGPKEEAAAQMGSRPAVA
jgi:3',5'-cyclic AMP phosphodiesterase CpdA